MLIINDGYRYIYIFVTSFIEGSCLFLWICVFPTSSRQNSKKRLLSEGNFHIHYNRKKYCYSVVRKIETVRMNSLYKVFDILFLNILEFILYLCVFF